MMRTYSKSGRALAGIMAVIFLMTSLLTFSVSADMSVAETSTSTVAVGETATINVAGAVGTEQTTVLVYLGTPEDENIIFIDQKAATDGTATFTFKVPTTAAAGTYTVLAGSYSSDAAGEGSLVVTAGSTDPDPADPTLESIAVAEDAKVEYTVGDEFVAPAVTGKYSDGSTATIENATFEGYDLSAAGTQTVTVKVGEVSTTYEITVAAAPVVENWAVVATRDDDDTVGFASDAFNSRWNGQTSADKVTYVSANGQGLDGTNAIGFNYARSGQWGGVQTAKTPSTVDWTKVNRISLYARIIPTDTNNEVKFTMRVNGPNKSCSFTANTGWQYFEFDLSKDDLTSVGDPAIQFTQDKAGTGRLVVDNLTFSNYQITPIAKLLQSVTTSDAKTEYTVGDEFVAPTVTAAYSDGTTATITDATITGYDMATAGKQTVTVSYKGFTATYDITVTAPVKVVKSIAVSTNAKVEYTVGDSFVAPEVTATYDDDSSEVVTGAAFAGYDMTTAGTQTVTVSYGGQTTSYEITVAAGTLEPWAVVATRDDDDTVGFASDAFNSRWNGESSSDKISNTNGSGLGLNGSNSTAFTYSRAGGWSGVQTATLPATVDLTKTTNFSFYARIIPTTEGVTSSSFNVNFAGDAKCTFEATTGWQFFTFDLSSYDLTATTQLQFQVNTKNAGTLVLDNLTFSNYGVSPVSPLLQSIAVADDAQVEFELNAEFVAPKVTASYNDGTTAEVDATFEGYNMASNGEQTVTATYQGFTATYDIVVGDAEGPVANPNVRNGSTSAAVTVNTSSYDFHLKYNVAIEPNTDYILTAWSKGSGSVLLVGRLNGSWGGGDARNLTLSGGDEWKHNALAFNSGAVANGKDVASVTLCFVANGKGSKGTMYVDDVFLAKASDPTVNLIPDPGFEKGEWGTDKAVAMETSELAVSTENVTLAAINEKTAYTIGDEFVAPTKVVIVKNDGTTTEVTGATIEGYDMVTAGTQTVTVKYDNLVTKYLITVSPILESIAVAEDAVVEYEVGDEFVAPIVTATYSDGSTATVEATFTGYDLATVGTQTVTATYEDKTTTYEITVKEAENEPTLKSLAISQDTIREYTVGDEFVAPTVIATYSDGSEKDVTAEVTITGYDLSVPSIQQVTVEFETQSVKYYIDVKAAGLELIKIRTGEQKKTEYYVGEELVMPQIIAEYEDGSTKDVTAEARFEEEYDMSAPDEITVCVIYQNKSIYYVVTVTAKEEPPVNPDVNVLKSYLDLDFEDAAYAQKDDGTGTMVDDYWNMTTTNKATGNKVTVAFSGTNEGNRYQVYEADGNKYIATKGRKTQVAYEFYPEAPVDDAENLVYVEAKIKRTSYNNDDPVSFVVTDDSNNVIFRLNYKQNVTPVLVADSTYETVTYPNNGDWNYIRAIIDFNKSTFELYQGASLDAMIAMVDGTTSFGFASSSAASVAKIGNISVGDRKGSLGFDDVKIYTVAGPEKIVESITVAADVKTAYYVGDEFVAPAVTAKYTDSYYDDEVVTATFEGYDLTTAGTQTVTVKVGEVSTTYEITVIELAIEAITVSENAVVEYTVGDEFVAPVVTAKYNNGSTAEVEATFEGYDLTTAGTQTVTVKVGEVSTTYEITVKDAAPGYTAEVLTSDILDEETGVVYVKKFVLAEGNGTSIVKIGDVELTWSAERECYVGIIDADNYVEADKALLNVSVTAAPAALESFLYGDNTDDGRINISDLAFYKNYLELDRAMVQKLAADVNVDGRLDGSDLSILKDHIEKNEPALKEKTGE